MNNFNDISAYKDESFRDSIATVTKEGKRKWIYPVKPQGKLYEIRKILSYIYLIIFFTLPFIKINGHPILQFNIIERKFIFFGSVFWPDDFFILAIAMLTMLVFIILFTVIYGRLFCGWVCPQTIFMEFVFRRIEYWIEGNASKQILLDKQPWNNKKILIKSIKWLIFFAISFLVANIFLAYIIGIDELFKIISEPVDKHIIGFISLLLFSTIFFFVFTWFREQVCLIVCPYGRLQGVMLDKNSIVVVYDYLRGEPRHKFNKNETRSKGNCIDCGLCVRVCPTGIDIRNGTQLECINCTACIDACDGIMEKVGLPKKLIRYDSQKGISQNERKIFTNRTIAYSTVLGLLLVSLAFLLVGRSNISTKIIRTPGKLFVEENDGNISNLYNIKIINKSYQDVLINLIPESNFMKIKMLDKNLIAKAQTKAEGLFFILYPKEKIKKQNTQLKIAIYYNGMKKEIIQTSFLGPIHKNNLIKKQY
jgi:cytochrome c oxidase accessory protein FixG